MHISPANDTAPQSVFAQVYEEARQLITQLQARSITPQAAQAICGRLRNSLASADQDTSKPTDWDTAEAVAQVCHMTDAGPSQTEDAGDVSEDEVMRELLVGTVVTLQAWAIKSQLTKQGRKLESKALSLMDCFSNFDLPPDIKRATYNRAADLAGATPKERAVDEVLMDNPKGAKRLRKAPSQARKEAAPNHPSEAAGRGGRHTLSYLIGPTGSGHIGSIKDKPE